MMDLFSRTKIIFVPKNTTSRLMPLDPEINQNLKVKYRKRLVKYVHVKINQNSSVTQIIKNVNILVAIR